MATAAKADGDPAHQCIPPNGTLDFTDPNAPTVIPPGSTASQPAQSPLLGAEIALSPTLLDNGSGAPSPDRLLPFCEDTTNYPDLAR